MRRVIEAVDSTGTPPLVAEVEGERKLLAAILTQAWNEAGDVRNSVGVIANRNGARAWLRERPGFTAQECCHALGIDYEAMMTVLESQWAEKEKKRAHIRRENAG